MDIEKDELIGQIVCGNSPDMIYSRDARFNLDTEIDYPEEDEEY